MLLPRDDGRFLRAAAAGASGDAPIVYVAEGRYRALCERHGTFSVELPTAEAAAVAAHVLYAVQIALADAMAWGAWPDGRRTRPRTTGEIYFRGIADDTRREARALVSALRPACDWADDDPCPRSIREVTIGRQKAFRIEVAHDSLVLATHAGTLDRAVAFLMLYTALQRDLREILGWEPL